MASARHDTLLNLLGACIPLAVAIPAVPLYLHLIGAERYGIIGVCWVLVGYFAFFDFGMGRAVNQRLSAQPAQAARVLWIGLSLSAGLGALGGLLVVVGGQVLLARFNIATTMRLEAAYGLPWLGAAVISLTLTAVLQGVLEARGRFLASNAVSISANTLLQVLPLLAAWLIGPNLAVLLAAMAVARGLSLLLGVYFNRELLRRFTPFTWLEARQLLQFGGWVTVTGIIGPLLTVADQVLIGVVIGASALAHYNIAYNVITRALIVSSATMRALFPRLAQQDSDAALEIRGVALLSIMSVMTVLVLLGGLSLRAIFTLWLGLSVAQSVIPVALILLLGVWFNALAFVPFNWLQAKGAPEVPAQFHLAELLPYAALLWFLLPRIGVIAAAYVWVFRAVVDAGLLFWATRDVPLLTRVILPNALLIVVALTLAFFPALWLLQLALSLTGCAWAYQQAPAQLKNLLHRAKPAAGNVSL